MTDRAQHVGFVPMSAIRVRGGAEREGMRAFPPLGEGHPSLEGGECAVCGQALRVGDVPTVVPLGPGADIEAQAKAMRGGWYSCLGVIAHAACAGIAPEVPGA